MTTPSPKGHSLRRVRILAAAIVLGSLAACGGDSSPPPPPPPTSGPTDLSVAVTAPTGTVVPGRTTSWTVVVSNLGPWPAPSATITNVVDPATTTITGVTCRASGNAHCPQLLGASMTVGLVPVGETLSFQVDTVITAGTNGTVTESAFVQAPNDTALDNNNATSAVTVQSNDVTVSNVAAAPTIPAGQPTTFTAVIANNGPAVATNLVISQGLSAGLKLEDTTCSAAGGAVCPADTTFPLSVDTLPVGGTLTLATVASVRADARGPVTSTVGVKDDNDGQPGNNSAVATATVVDGRGGAYQLYATDAKIYTLTVDFDGLTYAVVGNGVDKSGALTTSDGVTYQVSASQDIRASSAATDLLVGALDFGAGPKAFIAARSFATSSDDAGSAPFTVFGIATSAGGVATSTFESQSIGADGTLSNCTSTAQIFRVGACPGSSLASYALTFSGADITGTDAVDNDTIHFRVAKSGTTRLVLRAETDPACDCSRFAVGVTDNVLPLGGKFGGASSNGSTGGLSLTDTSYAAQWLSPAGVTSSDTATLALQGTSAPVGLRGGVRASDGAFIYVIENAPIALAMGSFNGAANGTMEIWGE